MNYLLCTMRERERATAQGRVSKLRARCGWISGEPLSFGNGPSNHYRCRASEIPSGLHFGKLGRSKQRPYHCKSDRAGGTPALRSTTAHRQDCLPAACRPVLPERV